MTSLALCLAAAWLTSSALSAVFVGQQASQGLRAERVAMAAKKELAKRDLTPDKKLAPISPYWADKLTAQTGSFGFSEGAENKVQIITPLSTTEDFQKWASLAPNFFFLIAFFTWGGIVEWCRFFPDALEW
jgi:hypothetical protein